MSAENAAQVLDFYLVPFQDNVRTDLLHYSDLWQRARLDLSYLHPPIEGRALVEIPVSWVLDDAPYFMFTGQRSIQAPGPVLQGWLTEFGGIAETHGMTNFTFHPQIIGRPSRLACLRELIDHVRHTPRVWIAPLGEIATHWRSIAR